ncbi:hypothetical protein [Roseobacter sp. HKCCA0434]|uniref:hypothetical protein n=1 Tax=Roseobacter sp. HKCCA0434 TaxID=3079297 RepID=UPI002905DA06|nr:hypothetical protein [Roseobacter sp. HKCCA0434]
MTSLRRTAALALTLSTLPALAQDGQSKVLVAQCTAGQGCACVLGATTMEETAVLLGVAPPPEGYVLLSTGETLSFDPRGLDALHRAHGGDGDCEIDLFPDEPAGEAIVPRDGLWAAEVRDVAFSQCNPMMERMLTASGALNRPPESRRLAWGGRFDPSVLDLYADPGHRTVWRPAGPNGWTGSIFEESACDGDTCSGVGVEAEMRIASPTHIRSSTVLDISSMVPDAGGMAEMAAMGLAACEVTMSFDIRHMGD